MKRFLSSLLILVLLSLIGLGLYKNSLNNEFHYDDYHHIVLNPNITNLQNIPDFFTKPQSFSLLPGRFLHYRPLVLTSYAMNYYSGKLKPTGYHLVNLALHVGSAFILFLILQHLLINVNTSLFIPLSAALLFLCNPFNSEVVNYVTARSSVMSTFFYLLSFFFWIRFRNTRKGGNIYLYIASFLMFILAIMSKEIAVTLPVILWLYDVYLKPNLESKGIQISEINGRDRYGIPNYKYYLQYLPFVLTGILITVVTRVVFFGSLKTLGENHKPIFSSIIIQMKVLAKYAFAMLFPVQLSSQHYINNTMDVYFYLSTIMIIGSFIFIFILWKYYGNWGKTGAFFIIWFYVTLIPTTVVPLNNPYQENRGYIAAIVFSTLLAICLGVLRNKWYPSKINGKFLSYILLLAILFIYSTGVVTRNPVWSNTMTLYSDVLSKYPQSPDAHGAIGNYYLQRGELRSAAAEYQEELKINPNSSEAYTGLGIVYFKRKELEKGMEFFTKALEIEPDEIATNYYMAQIYASRGDLSSASRHIFVIIANSPGSLRPFEMLVDIYAKTGKLDDAYKLMMKADRDEPENPGVHRALGLIYKYQGQWVLAQEAFKKVLYFQPNDKQTLADMYQISLRLEKQKNPE